MPHSAASYANRTHWRREGRDRFWGRVKKRTDGKKCWEWTGYNLGGYGGLWVNRVFFYAHRYSWFLHHGEVPAQCVLHKCDNPVCVRPSHLFLGTNLENIKDRDRKGRQCKGERHHAAKLTEDDVREIRRRCVPGCRKGNGQRGLAREFGVSKPTINDIVNGTGWKHVK